MPFTAVVGPASRPEPPQGEELPRDPQSAGQGQPAQVSITSLSAVTETVVIIIDIIEIMMMIRMIIIMTTTTMIATPPPPPPTTTATTTATTTPKGVIQIFFSTVLSQRRDLSPTHTLKWPGRNRVQITCNASGAYEAQYV